MYWPIGAPRVYAATLSGSNKDLENQADDHNVPGEYQPDAPEHGSSPAQDPTAAVFSPDHGRDKNSSVSSKGKVETSRQRTTTTGTRETKSDSTILGLEVCRHGHLFATITGTALTVWQTRVCPFQNSQDELEADILKPTAVLAEVRRASQSLTTCGPNVSLLIRPDSAIFVVHTSLGYLITYSLATDPEARVYQTSFSSNYAIRSRSHSKQRGNQDDWYPLKTLNGDSPFREISLRFRMAIKVDAGISAALALDDELVVATKKPAAVQCIRWTPDSTGNQTSTELVSRMSWLSRKAQVLNMIYNKPMNVFIWLTSDGKAHAVQRTLADAHNSEMSRALFHGHSFHHADVSDDDATSTAVNARFSLIAIGTAGGSVYIYTLRDYAGNIPSTHRLHPPVPFSISGGIQCLTYSPDGYCLFVGLQKGWMAWSVFGRPGGSSFPPDGKQMDKKTERWIGTIQDGRWVGGGAEMLLVAEHDQRIWVLEFARSAMPGCFMGANTMRALLLRRSAFMTYRGHNLPDLSSISAEALLWQTVQIPDSYLEEQGPIRSAVISPDGRYVAVAGRRGLAHYSMSSGRWKMFEKLSTADEFAVRGGMCWHQHILIAAVETDEAYEVRLATTPLPT